MQGSSCRRVAPAEEVLRQERNPRTLIWSPPCPGARPHCLHSTDRKRKISQSVMHDIADEDDSIANYPHAYHTSADLCEVSLLGKLYCPITVPSGAVLRRECEVAHSVFKGRNMLPLADSTTWCQRMTFRIDRKRRTPAVHRLMRKC